MLFKFSTVYENCEQFSSRDQVVYFFVFLFFLNGNVYRMYRGSDIAIGQWASQS